MKLLIIGDLHGKKPKLRFRSNAIIAPGDFCSDAIRKYLFQSIRKNVEWEKLAGKKARSMVIKQFSDGRKVLDHLNRDGRPVYAIPGNWEQTRMQKKYRDILKGLRNINDCHYKLRRVGGYDLIGYGYNSGPEDKTEYRNAKKKLGALFAKTTKPIIFLTHNMPYGVMDKIKNKQSPRYGERFGSIVARDIIEKYKPLVAIGGHMHEYFGKKKHGRTTIINAGFGPTKNVLLTLKGRKVQTRFYN